MVTFTMMVGLPGSGKSFWAERHAEQYGAVVISSDAIRKELYGDEAVQDNPEKVFHILHDRVFTNLRNGKNVIYDATNLSMKRRRGFLRQLSSAVNIPICKICVFMATPIDRCIARDSARDRMVGKSVIHRMACSFQVPYYNEGWDSIVVDEYYASKVYMNEELDKAADFDQKNHHHSLTLGKHIAVAAKHVIDAHGSFEAVIAADHHDVGKLYVQTTDEEGECHYKGHDNYGAYLYLTSDHASVLSRHYGWNKTLYVAALINWHMLPYQLKTRSELRRWAVQHGFTEEFSNDLWVLHQADREAH